MEHDSLMMMLTGPVSALALAVAMLWGIGRLVSKYVPQLVDKHLAQIDEQIAANKQMVERLDQMRDLMSDHQTQQTEVTRGAVAGIHKRLNPIERDISDMKTYLKLDQLNQQSQQHNNP